MPRGVSDIDKALLKAITSRDKAKGSVESAKERLKKAEEEVSRLEMLKNSKTINELQAAVSAKGLSFDSLINAINSGNFTALQESATAINSALSSAGNESTNGSSPP